MSDPINILVRQAIEAQNPGSLRALANILERSGMGGDEPATVYVLSVRSHGGDTEPAISVHATHDGAEREEFRHILSRLLREGRSYRGDRLRMFGDKAKLWEEIEQSLLDAHPNEWEGYTQGRYAVLQEKVASDALLSDDEVSEAILTTLAEVELFDEIGWWATIDPYYIKD